MHKMAELRIENSYRNLIGSNKGLLAPEARDIPHILHVILLLCGNNQVSSKSI